MAYYQLNYFSKQTKAFNNECLNELELKAAQFNLKHEITGILMFKKGYFVQIIEGRKENLELLYAKITGDNRHQVIRPKFLKKVSTRSFSDWSMKVVQTDVDLSNVRQLDHDAYFLLSYFKNYFAL